MALADVAALATNPAFRDRVRAALVDGAVDALSAAPPPTPRLGRFAASALRQQGPATEDLAWGVAAHLEELGQIATATDAQIRQALGAVWDAFAGYEEAAP